MTDYSLQSWASLIFQVTAHCRRYPRAGKTRPVQRNRGVPAKPITVAISLGVPPDKHSAEGEMVGRQMLTIFLKRA